MQTVELQLCKQGSLGAEIRQTGEFGAYSLQRGGGAQILQTVELGAGGIGVFSHPLSFFFVPPPLRGYPLKKKLAPRVGIFFRQEKFFFAVCYLNLHVTFTLLHCMTLAHELLLR